MKERTPMILTLVLVATTVACGGMMTAQDGAPLDDAATMNDNGVPNADVPASGDSGMVSPPPEVDIRISQSCAALAPCGGDPSGTWAYTAVCIPDLLDELRAQCPGMTVEGMGRGRGAVTFAGGTVTRNVSASVNVTATFPAVCTFGSCATVESALHTAGFADARCSNAATGCRCTFVVSSGVNETSPYVVSGTQIVAGGNRYDFCVQGGTLRYREVGSSARERGIADLSRR